MSLSSEASLYKSCFTRLINSTRFRFINISFISVEHIPKVTVPLQAGNAQHARNSKRQYHALLHFSFSPDSQNPYPILSKVSWQPDLTQEASDHRNNHNSLHFRYCISANGQQHPACSVYTMSDIAQMRSLDRTFINNPCT